jgi:hypothetical protein
MSAELSVSVNEYVAAKGATWYVIKVSSIARAYEVRRQYGQFVEVYEALMYKYPAVGKFSMPGRNYLCCETETLMERRREKFNEFCKILVKVSPKPPKEIMSFFELADRDILDAEGSAGALKVPVDKLVSTPTSTMTPTSLEYEKIELTDVISPTSLEYVKVELADIAMTEKKTSRLEDLDEVGVDQADYLDEVGVDMADYLPEVGVDAEDFRGSADANDQSQTVAANSVGVQSNPDYGENAVVIGEGQEGLLMDEDEDGDENEYEFLERALGGGDPEEPESDTQIVG